jgi:hypothetical protein
MCWKIRRVNEEWRLVYEDPFDPYSFPSASGTAEGLAARWRRWLRDPLSHPDLRRMSVTELADLPFDPHRFSPE